MTALDPAAVEALAKWLCRKRWGENFPYDPFRNQAEGFRRMACALLANPPAVLRQRCKEMEEGKC